MSSYYLSPLSPLSPTLRPQLLSFRAFSKPRHLLKVTPSLFELLSLCCVWPAPVTQTSPHILWPPSLQICADLCISTRETTLSWSSTTKTKQKTQCRRSKAKTFLAWRSMLVSYHNLLKFRMEQTIKAIRPGNLVPTCQQVSGSLKFNIQ